MRIASGWTLITVALFVMCGYHLASAASPPYSPSPVIESVTFDPSSHIEKAPGSDNWAITWANDDHQYTTWGDGGGFGGTNSDGRVSLGFGRVEGTKDNYTGFNVYGGKNPENPANINGKSYGIISINGNLYAWRTPGSNVTGYTSTKLMKSTDHAATWTLSNWDLTVDRDSTIIKPTILNYGQDYDGNTDGYVYHYFIKKQGSPSSLDVHIPGVIWLARITVTDMESASWADDIDDNLEWFSGCSSSHCTATNATWGAAGNESARQPVFENATDIGPV